MMIVAKVRSVYHSSLWKVENTIHGIVHEKWLCYVKVHHEKFFYRSFDLMLITTSKEAVRLVQLI